MDEELDTEEIDSKTSQEVPSQTPTDVAKMFLQNEQALTVSQEEGSIDQIFADLAKTNESESKQGVAYPIHLSLEGATRVQGRIQQFQGGQHAA